MYQHTVTDVFSMVDRLSSGFQFVTRKSKAATNIVEHVLGMQAHISVGHVVVGKSNIPGLLCTKSMPWKQLRYTVTDVCFHFSWKHPHTL